jgi:hypothetical protein
MTATMPQVSTLDQDWTNLSYTQLVANLGALTRLGVFEEESLAGALAVARLMDRGRIVRSGLSVSDLQQALDRYRVGDGWAPISAIEQALERAVAIAGEAPAPR